MSHACNQAECVSSRVLAVRLPRISYHIGSRHSLQLVLSIYVLLNQLTLCLSLYAGRLQVALQG